MGRLSDPKERAAKKILKANWLVSSSPLEVRLRPRILCANAAIWAPKILVSLLSRGQETGEQQRERERERKKWSHLDAARLVPLWF